MFEAAAKTGVFLLGNAKETLVMQSIPLYWVADQMTALQLRYLGAGQVVYLKVGVFDGEQGCMIYSADGGPLEMVDTVETATQAAAENGLGLVSLH
jgi:hypothetical protein